MPDPNSPVARVSLGSRIGMDLYDEPRAGAIPVPLTAAIVLGWTIDEKPVIVVTQDLAWLDALESAIQVARAQAVVEAGMVPA